MPLLHLEALPPRTTKGELLRLLCSAGGIGRTVVGKIELQGFVAVIEVPAGWEQRLARALDGIAFKGRSLRAWAGGSAASSAAAEDHFRRLIRLLDLEAEAEARQMLERLGDLHDAEAERSGECLLGLVIVEESSGLGGRCLLTLAKRNRSMPLPWNRFEPGAPVLLSPAGGRAAEGWRGVVCERGERSLSVAFNEPPDELAMPAYRLDIAADEASRQRAALGTGAGVQRSTRSPGDVA